jgi:leucyl aminopeptidase
LQSLFGKEGIAMAKRKSSAKQQTTSKTTSKKTAASMSPGVQRPVPRAKHPLEVEIPSLLAGIRQGFKGTSPSQTTGRVYILGLEDRNQSAQLIENLAPRFQKATLKKQSREVMHFMSDDGPVWIISPRVRKGPFSHQARLEDSPYSWMRDQVGSLVGLFKAYQVDQVHFELHATSDEQERGFFVALEMAAYQYRATVDGLQLTDFPKVYFQKLGGVFSKENLASAQAIGSAVNLARHLVNTPPNFMNPATMAAFVRKNFARAKGMKVEIWDAKRLEKENMNLHLGVGRGAEHAPCLVHLKYRPAKAKKNARPIAFVGKGVTFDTGGVDIKPSAGMRLMKKDMGGSAAVLALAKWAADTQYERPLDFYLAMAENAVDANSFRPSDVLMARNGMQVEIHNTDAEGRLVLADALDVAVTQKGNDDPEIVIDVATLTGAIKVALGGEISGLFSNDDTLADDLNRAGQESGDLNWRMPLYGRYTSGFSSPFADIVNAVDGFAGAITAALFLEKFTRQKPWAHLDIYAWNDKSGGPLTFSGGSGQAVQCLVQYLEGKV